MTLPVRTRGPVAAVVAGAIAAALLLAPPAVAGKAGGGRNDKGDKAATRTADKTWSGYRLRDDGRASGGFLGARQVGGTVVYRIDPQAKKPVAKAFGAPAYADVLAGSGKKTVTALDTQRAAYILGKYGAYRLAVQDAAVEIALDELLVGGKYSLRGAQTEKRLAQLTKPQRTRVVSFAKTMLAGSLEFASTYSVTMASTPSVVLGGAVSATVAVVNRANGVGIASLPVTFSYPGAPAQVVRTDAAGRATVSFGASAAGPQTVSASVANVPETRLVVLTPTTRKASRVVVADVKTASATTAITAVQAQPVLSITRSFGSVASPYSTSGQRFALAGTYPGARTATATLWGPYTSDALANCQGTGKNGAKGSVAVRADGSYALPKLTLPAQGYYRWSVSLPADPYNTAATTICGGVMVRGA